MKVNYFQLYTSVKNHYYGLCYYTLLESSYPFQIVYIYVMHAKQNYMNSEVGKYTIIALPERCKLVQMVIFRLLLLLQNHAAGEILSFTQRIVGLSTYHECYAFLPDDHQY